MFLVGGGCLFFDLFVVVFFDSGALILKPNVIPCDLFPLNVRSISEDTKKAKYQHDLSFSCTQIAS